MGKFAETFAFLSALSFLLALTEGCSSKFENHEKFTKLDKTCLGKVGLSKSPPSSEDLMKPEFDDKGYGKCMLYGLEVITEDGNFDRDILLDMIDDKAPKPLAPKIAEIMNKCADSSKVDKTKVTKDGKTKAENKPFATFYGCFVSATEKLC